VTLASKAFNFMTIQFLPLVSIGVPTYNRPKTLEKTLASLVRQTYPNIEIIVSDNCSPTPDTEQVVREYMERDSRIRYFKQERNIGVFYNFKFVFDVSTGDYFTWAADDDTRADNYIEACMNIFQQADQSSELLLVNSYSQMVDPNLQHVLKVDRGCTTVGLKPSQRYYRYLSSIYTEQAAIGDLIYGVIKSQPLKEVMEKQPNILDWDHIFLATLAIEGEFLSIPEPLMTSSPGGMSTLQDAKKMAKIQLIQNPLYINKAQWVRCLFLQQRVWSSSKIFIFNKIKLSIWVIFDTLVKHFMRSSSKIKVKVNN
jgi:glycosyltransferase involved in cell wall biosynthesis